MFLYVRILYIYTYTYDVLTKMGRVNRVFSNMSTSQLSSMLMLDEREDGGDVNIHTGEAPGL